MCSSKPNPPPPQPPPQPPPLPPTAPEVNIGADKETTSGRKKVGRSALRNKASVGSGSSTFSGLGS